MFFQGFPLSRLCFTPDEMQAIVINVKLVTEKNSGAVRQGLVALEAVAARFAGGLDPEAVCLHWERDHALLKRQLVVALYMHDVLRKSSKHPALPAFLYHMVLPPDCEQNVRGHVTVLAELLPLLRSHLPHINGKKVMFAFVCRMRQFKEPKQVHYYNEDEEFSGSLGAVGKGKTWRHFDVAMQLYEKMHAYVNQHLGSTIDSYVCVPRRTTPPKGTVLTIPVNAYTACRHDKDMSRHFVDWLGGDPHSPLIDFLLHTVHRFPFVTLHALIVDRFLDTYAHQMPPEDQYLHLIKNPETDPPPGRAITVEEVLRIPLSPAFAGAIGGPRKRRRVGSAASAAAAVDPNAPAALPDILGHYDEEEDGDD
jgi:hypothetical protein